jgi:hypothetical protein
MPEVWGSEAYHNFADLVTLRTLLGGFEAVIIPSYTLIPSARAHLDKRFGKYCRLGAGRIVSETHFSWSTTSTQNVTVL